MLPDEEREISDADKERAILAKEAAEKEHDEGDEGADGDGDGDNDNDQDHEQDGELPPDGNDGTFS